MSDTSSIVAEQQHPVRGLRNFRDLGGLPTTDGGAIRPGVLFRSEAPILSDGGLGDLAALGLGTVFDLRDSIECERVPTTLPPGVRRVCLDVRQPYDHTGQSLLEQAMEGVIADFGPGDLSAIMVEMIDEHPEVFARVVTDLVGPESAPALVHCAAGKDRTGLVIAMILDVVGVEPAAIAADYERSTAGRAHRREQVMPRFAEVGVQWERMSGLFTAPPETFTAMFSHLQEGFGSARGYLEAAGVPARAFADLAELLVVREPGDV